MLAAVVLGVAVSVLGILLQGASAAGVSLWSSLEGVVIEDTLHSRFGEVWGARAIDWLALGVLLLASGAPRGDERPRRWVVGLLGLGSAYLTITPALGLIAGLSALVVVSEFDQL